MKITFVRAAVILVALGSVAACGSKPDVRYVEVPATDAPGFTLPTQEPVLTAPPVINPGYDTFNDRILDDYEYADLVQVLTSNGYSYATQDTTEALGVAMCDIAEVSATGDEFAQTVYDLIVKEGLDPYEIGFAIGAITSAMCATEMSRLGFAGANV